MTTTQKRLITVILALVALWLIVTIFAPFAGVAMLFWLLSAMEAAGQI